MGHDLQDGLDAYKRKDYKTAYKLLLPFADRGNLRAKRRLKTIEKILEREIGLAEGQRSSEEEVKKNVKRLKVANSCVKCDLEEADLTEADLKNADLNKADLTGANLYGANLDWGKPDCFQT